MLKSFPRRNRAATHHHGPEYKKKKKKRGGGENSPESHLEAVNITGLPRVRYETVRGKPVEEGGEGVPPRMIRYY